MKKINDNFLVGSDPEVFLRSTITGELVSSIGIIGGSKEKPLPMDKYGFFCQEDNVLAEFNIPPAKSGKEFVKFITEGIEMLSKRLPQGIEVDISPYGFFKAKELRAPKAREFGCDPDYNCWTKQVNDEPVAGNKLLRTAGGHILIGYDNHNFDTNIELIKWMDMLIGVPSVLMSDEAPRRELYGKMGAMRAKDFGVEYRTVSNFWLKSKERTKWAYEQTQMAIELTNSGTKRTYKDTVAIEVSINENNKKAAEYLINKYKINLV